MWKFHMFFMSTSMLCCGRRKSLGLIPNAKKRHSKRRSWWQRFFFDEEGNWLGLKDEDMLDALESEASSSDDELSENEKWKRRAETIVELREAQEDVKNEESRRWEDWLVDETTDDVGNGASWFENSNGSVGKPGNDVGEEITELFSGRGLVKSVRDLVLGREEDDILYEDRVFRYASFNSAKFLAVLIIVPWAVDFLVHDYVLMPFLDSFTSDVRIRREVIVTRDNQPIAYPDTARVLICCPCQSKSHYYAVAVAVAHIISNLSVILATSRSNFRYVKTVPLAAKMLDIRKNQKLQIVKALNLEKARYRLEVEIGKSPPLSDDELYLELRHRALEMRDEWRLENRKAFANIWSDVVFGISLFLLLYFYQGQVALLKFTGYKIVNNITDTGKAFLIILITDIFLGYHSESGWQTLLEIIVEHYGLEVDQSAITIFICLIPVVMDACVKLWVRRLSCAPSRFSGDCNFLLIVSKLAQVKQEEYNAGLGTQTHCSNLYTLQLFKFLPRLSPKVSNIFQEMKRH
ncbi:Chloroplast envelope membrane protein [Sesamum angolense]|uniref:Chloroplast envelope membrane protein n=1 Tax=Sesamum angolense TaxID=2727404 RepID=A0AAE2BT04_9LAMI|nr:Chloroplast envelope membrane protein [Sesamum angolense]